MILFYLVLAFGIGTIGVGIQTWLIAKRNILWRGTSLRFASGDTSKIREFRDIETMTQTVWGGVALNFDDGAALNLDPNAQGARELFEALSSFLDAHPDNSK